MDSMPLRLSKLTLLIQLAELCFVFGIELNEHQNSKFESVFCFLSFRP